MKYIVIIPDHIIIPKGDDKRAVSSNGFKSFDDSKEAVAYAAIHRNSVIFLVS